MWNPLGRYGFSSDGVLLCFFRSLAPLLVRVAPLLVKAYEFSLHPSRSLAPLLVRVQSVTWKGARVHEKYVGARVHGCSCVIGSPRSDHPVPAVVISVLGECADTGLHFLGFVFRSSRRFRCFVDILGQTAVTGRPVRRA